LQAEEVTRIIWFSRERGRALERSPALAAKRRPQGVAMRFEGWLVAAAFTWNMGAAGLMQAHPVPKDNHDRTLVVRLSGEAVRVDYRLELDEGSAGNELPRSEAVGLATRTQVARTFCQYFADVLADNLVADLDGQRLQFRCVERSHLLKDHLRCDYLFEARWRPSPDRTHEFTFRECNYDNDTFSILRLSLTSEGRVSLVKAEEPSEALKARPGADRKPLEMDKLRRASATFRLTPELPKGSYKPALPPDLDIPRDGPDQRDSAVSVKGNTGLLPAANKPSGDADDTSLPAPKTLLDLLLDSRYGIGVLLLLAATFGAAHALTPGHGKTLVAAYLIGERGTVWHALLLGFVVTLTHTGAVLILAALLPVFFPDAARQATVQTALGLVGGLLIAGLGFWLLLARLTGRADHVHIGGGHHHHHQGPGHHHDHDHHQFDPKAVGWRGLVVLGISGGIVPCWDAILMLVFAISAQRLWLAFPLLLAFSAGLAGVLIALGIGVVWARDFAGGKWNQGERFRRLVRALPLVSALVVTGMGLWLCYDSMHTDSPKTQQAHVERDK
jgi:ABC-type nickel/cobalt efflux system permease component RcnA